MHCVFSSTMFSHGRGGLCQSCRFSPCCLIGGIRLLYMFKLPESKLTKIVHTRPRPNIHIHVTRINHPLYHPPAPLALSHHYGPSLHSALPHHLTCFPEHRPAGLVAHGGSWRLPERFDVSLSLVPPRRTGFRWFFRMVGQEKKNNDVNHNKSVHRCVVIRL